jgi:hypothetical protein
VIVRIPQRELEVCYDLAKHRWLEKRGGTNRPNYQAGLENGKLEHELLATIRTMVAEVAVAYVTDRKWSVPVYSKRFHKERGKFSDVGDNIEVRTVRTKDHVPIWEKDAGKVIFACKVLDPDFFSEVEVYGYIPADVAMQHTEYFDPDPEMNGWRYPLTALSAIEPFPPIRVALID